MFEKLIRIYVKTFSESSNKFSNDLKEREFYFVGHKIWMENVIKLVDRNATIVWKFD